MTGARAAVDEAEAPQPSAPEKLDPETLVLRARPARAIRFKRRAIVAIAAVGSLGLAGTAWFALKPSAFRIVSQSDDTPLLSTGPNEALSSLPASYGDAPKLGPPLPGDLGGPILERQRAMATETVPGAPVPATSADAAREQRAAELKAARESALMVQTGDGSGFAPAKSAAPSVASSSPPDAGTPGEAIDLARDPNAQSQKRAFVGAVDQGSDINSHVLVSPPSPFMLSAGSVIAASLITGLRSDLPGLVTAQVTERVFDSATGRIELIPQGARLIGSYDSVVAFGQKRALIVWQRIIMPDGSSLRIDNVPASDASGYAGLVDKVDFHTWTLLKGVALSTILGVGSNLTFSGESDLVQAIRESTQQNASRAGDQLTSRNLQIQPTITIRPGAPVRLIVHRDLILAPPGK